MSKKKQLLFAYYPPICLILSVLCMTAISAAAHRAPFMEAFSFFLFQVICVILPGTALNCLLPIKQLNRMENILISYVWGYLLNIGVYFLTVPFGLGRYIGPVYIVLAAVSVWILICRNDKGSAADARISKNEAIGIAMTILLFLIYLVVFSLRWAMTDRGADFHNDLLFWVGNTIALKEKFLPIDFRSLYGGYKYHYLGSMQQAVAAIVTDMRVFDLAVRYSFIESVIFLGLSASCFVMRLVKNHKAVVLALVLVLFSTGFEDQSVVSYIWHIYLVPMSFEIAYSLEMLIMLLLYVQNREKRTSWYILTAMMLCLAVCTGTKGPSGMIALGGIGMMCIYWMFVRKEYGKAMIYGMASLLSFGIVYLLLLAVRQQGYVTEPAVAAGAANSVSAAADAGSMVQVLSDKLSGAVLWLAGYFRYIFLTNPWTFVPALFYSCYKIVKRSISIEQIILLVMVVIGSVLGYHIQYEGGSQMYFTLSVCSFAAVLVGTGFDGICRLFQEKGQLYRAVTDIVIAVLIVMIGRITVIGNYRGHLQVHARTGLAVLRDEPCEDTTIWNWILSPGEYQAYDWIRENTEEDAVFLSDVFFINGYSSYYYPGVFTERHIFFYRDDGDIVPGRACYDGDESAVAILKEKGVDYIIQSKYRSSDFVLSEALGEKKYENDEMAVYKLR